MFVCYNGGEKQGHLVIFFLNTHMVHDTFLLIFVIKNDKNMSRSEELYHSFFLILKKKLLDH